MIKVPQVMCMSMSIETVQIQNHRSTNLNMIKVPQVMCMSMFTETVQS